MITGQSNSTIYLYCDQFLSELKFDPPDESELSNGIFKYLEPYLDQRKNDEKIWSTVYQCKINFKELRDQKPGDCKELIETDQYELAK